ncbi:hypothetical protein QQS21_000017 [Conoideocrella luteorostrata]|uniref:Alpha/beta hydrolase fold-3 domain-containing protein n=1 Tax=Conoideocrella luteorostrata TaxID=1105319 RepID=A0AAJ0CZG2_9HYPO|nr:hypothetical protein QQS21_000017 [Conoideocrella luteorostrata]
MSDKLNDVNPLRHREHAVDLSLWEWVLTLAQATWITSGLVGKAVKGILPGTRKDDISFHEYIAYQGMRDYQCRLSPVRIQNLVTSTAKTCSRFAKRHGIPHTTIKLDDGTVAHRLGPQYATRTNVFFHGGGYMAPALNEHIDFAFGFSQPPRKDLAVFVLQYGLVSEGANQYPCQLQQATSLLNHLLHTENISPSSIILLGDSAGAHLLLSLALHLKHPNPKVSPLNLDGRLAGAVIASPWLNLYSTSESMRTCKKEDILDADALVYWASNFLAGAPSDCWNDPLTAPTEWWSDLPINDILITYGDDELLSDECKRLASILEAAHPSTTAVGCSGELHIHMIMNRFLFLNKPCESENVYTRWMESHMGTL